MKVFGLFIFSFLCFGQINWEIEVVDTVINNPLQNSLIVDTAGLPHIIYTKREYLIYTTKMNNNWSRERIDSGLFYACPSLASDKNGRLHCSYYQVVGQSAYLTYAYRDSTGWVKFKVDSIFGILTNWWFSSYFRTEIEIDTCGYPGIAYVSWNPLDSLFYIKYIHYNGVDWDSSVVEYDTIWAGHLYPSDRSVNLEINSHNKPLIAFHHRIYSGPCNDTIKLGIWSDSLQAWVVEPVVCNPYSEASISLALNNQDYPYIAHGVDGGLYCTWWDGTSWQSENTGFGIGWIGISIDLALDTLGKPHIFYYQSLIGPRYGYKDTIWHDCGIIDSVVLMNENTTNLIIDRMNILHITYGGVYWNSNTPELRYARGTFVGIKENGSKYLVHKSGLRIGVYPSVVQGVLNVNYSIASPGDIEIAIYDASGRKVRAIKQVKCLPGNYHRVIDTNDFPAGVYFVVLNQNNEKVNKKFLLIK